MIIIIISNRKKKNSKGVYKYAMYLLAELANQYGTTKLVDSLVMLNYTFASYIDY